MENDKAKIVISVSEGKFEISGSEKFVSSQIENFKDLITKSVNRLETPVNPNTTVSHQTNRQENTGPSDGSEVLNDDVYVEDDDTIKIISDLPGNSKAKKTLNAALLYAHARKIQGHEKANVEEIRRVCSTHACLDKANFSSHIKKGHPTYYIDKGSGKSRTIKITRPGTKEAKKLIEAIKQNGNA